MDTSDTVSSSTEVPDNDEFLSSIDDEIESAIAKIKEGSHIELAKRSDALRRAKESKVATADRHRKMQIKNINLLYEYELEDASALYNVSSQRNLLPVFLLPGFDYAYRKLMRRCRSR